MKKVLTFCLFISAITIIGQTTTSSSSAIQKGIEKLGVLNKVLYVAAHPDDENTRLISYLSKGLNIETAYLSLTRGDGGQNLIGTEKGSQLGVIRTNELLAARKVDGAQQFFTRAVDFGYSKNPEETFMHWNQDSVLADMVWVIRKFKPDVIITRFPPDSRAGHGHHTASAILAARAFDAAADSTQFLESAKKFGTWKTTSMYWNESVWWNKEIANHPENYVTVDYGTYDPVLGESYAEIASVSRSQHRSQGFGMAKQRGSRLEYLKFLKGDSLSPNCLNGNVRTWQYRPEAKKVQKLYTTLQKSYNARSPQQSIPILMDIKNVLNDISTDHYIETKKEAVNELIVQCAGLWLEARSSKPFTTRDEVVEIDALAISQNKLPFKLESVTAGKTQVFPSTTLYNSVYKAELKVVTPNSFSGPYWLSNPIVEDFFQVTNRNFISLPKNQPLLTVTYTLSYLNQEIKITRPVVYQWVDRADGEQYRALEFVDPISITFEKNVLVNPTAPIVLRVRANSNIEKATVHLHFTQSDTTISTTLQNLKSGQTVPVTFLIPTNIESDHILAHAEINGTHYHKGFIEIEYPHIPTQLITPLAEMKLVNQPFTTTRKNIGYIMGSGDEIPEALQQIGCTVTQINAAKTNIQQLQQFEGIVIGIRAYNTLDELSSLHPILMEYVKQGGFVMVQYNTNRGLATNQLGPYPFELSRTRVTQEDAPATWLHPEHPVFNSPNKLQPKDFDHWVQERGLYFATTWDTHYTPLIAWNDTNEEKAKGSLLVTPYGKGFYVFTGISFFRQLPAGVPGAYKLFANLISYGKE